MFLLVQKYNVYIYESIKHSLNLGDVGPCPWLGDKDGRVELLLRQAHGAIVVPR